VTDVYPEPYGYSRLIQDDMVRMRWRDGSPAKNMTPGQIYEVNVTLWATSYVYDQGHSLRVSVSSSNFPRFSATPNNGWALNTTGGGGPNNTATNTFYFGGPYLSRVTLPIVDLKDLPPIRLYDIQQQAEKLIGEEAVARILKSPSMIDSYVDASYAKIRQLNTPTSWQKAEKY